MWILILAMYANQNYTEASFSTANTQEFSTETTCLIAADKLKEEFKQMLDTHAIAICVKK